MKIVIPVEEEKGMQSRISAHFGQTLYWAIYDAESKTLEIKKNTAQHGGGGCQGVDLVAGLKPDILFTTGMGYKAIAKCAEQGISVKTGSYATVQEVVDNIDGLEDMTDGCSGGHEHSLGCN